MKTLGEVFDSQFGINLPQQISQGELTQLNINKQARLITLAVKFNGLVERNTLFDTEKLITKTLAYHTVIKPHFPQSCFPLIIFLSYTQP
jgi:DNA polymerase-3 subunit alpha (Gram-positive type)